MKLGDRVHLFGRLAWRFAALLWLSFALGGCASPSGEPETRTYSGKYSVIFDNAVSAIGRRGWYVESMDKEHGVITGYHDYAAGRMAFKIQLEPDASGQKTRVTAEMKANFLLFAADHEAGNRHTFFTELQLVMAGVPPSANGGTQSAGTPGPQQGGVQPTPSYTPPSPVSPPSCIGHGVGCP